MGQKRQQDFAQQHEEHQSQLDMFSTAISAAEKAGDWDKVAQFTGLLGDYTSGGAGKKGKGKRDTALHSIADALKSHVVEKPDAAAATPEQRGAALSKGLAGKAGLDELPKKKVSVGAFDQAQTRQRTQDIEDQERKAELTLKHDERLTDRATRLAHMTAERDEARQRRAADYKANGDVNKLAAMKMAADPELTPEEARKQAAEDVAGDRLAKQKAMVDKHNESVERIRNINSQISTRAGTLAVAQRNAATNERNAGTRARHEEWSQKAAAISAGMKPVMDAFTKVNAELNRLYLGRATVALNADGKKTPEQVAAELRQIDAEIDVQKQARDAYGQHIEGYKQQYEALEQETGAPPLPESTIPTGKQIAPMPRRSTSHAKSNDPMGIR